MFGRPEEEFTARLAYVDFDGARALAAAERFAPDKPLDDEFISNYCNGMVTATDKLCKWLHKKWTVNCWNSYINVDYVPNTYLNRVCQNIKLDSELIPQPLLLQREGAKNSILKIPLFLREGFRACPDSSGVSSVIVFDFSHSLFNGVKENKAHINTTVLTVYMFFQTAATACAMR